MDRDRAKGALLGLACGDALGRPIEFKSAERIRRDHGEVRDMLGDGTHGKPAGTVTDDTDMALCIARSLADCGGFDPEDVADRFVAWYERGPFDVGIMTADAITELRDGTPWDEAGQRVWERKPEGSNAGNGSVMRCVPYAIAFGTDLDCLEVVSGSSSAITHADPRCTAGCAALNLTIAGLVRGDLDPLPGALDRLADAPDELLSALRTVPDGVDPASLQSSGYVVHTLQTALYHGLTADSAEEAIVTAVNMGADTDTVGAVTGAVAGARFGASALPDRWIGELAIATEIASLADQLCALSADS